MLSDAATMAYPFVRWDILFADPGFRFSNTYNKSSPKSFRNSTLLPPCLRMHSPTTCASCSLYNVQQNITEALCIVTGHDRTLHSIAGCYGMLLKCYGSIIGCCRALQNIMEHCVTLRDVTGALRIVTECYRSITELLRNVMEL